MTGQQHTHVAFFNWGDLTADHPEKMARQPFNKDNPDGPLELCTCSECGAVLMLDDKEKRIRVAVPNVMGYDDAAFPDANYHAFWDESKGYPKPSDARLVDQALQPNFLASRGLNSLPEDCVAPQSGPSDNIDRMAAQSPTKPAGLRSRPSLMQQAHLLGQIESSSAAQLTKPAIGYDSREILGSR